MTLVTRERPHTHSSHTEQRQNILLVAYAYVSHMKHDCSTPNTSDSNDKTWKSEIVRKDQQLLQQEKKSTPSTRWLKIQFSALARCFPALFGWERAQKTSVYEPFHILCLFSVFYNLSSGIWGIFFEDLVAEKLNFPRRSYREAFFNNAFVGLFLTLRLFWCSVALGIPNQGSICGPERRNMYKKVESVENKHITWLKISKVVCMWVIFFFGGEWSFERAGIEASAVALLMCNYDHELSRSCKRDIDRTRIYYSPNFENDLRRREGALWRRPPELQRSCRSSPLRLCPRGAPWAGHIC